MKTNLDRIKKNIETIAEFTSTPGFGSTRFSYSSEDENAKEFLLNQMRELGLAITVDAVGNIRARLNGSSDIAPAVIVGSHVDTVKNGGRFDGVVGVVGALETISVIVENGIKIKNPIDLYIFVEEEGSNFGSTLAGSKVIAGKYGLDDIKKIKNDKGMSLYDIAKQAGLNPDDLSSCRLKPEDVKAMLELHIEQAAVLDSEKVTIGIVEAIAGMKVYRISLKGIGNHAGATPMILRNDPMVGAAKIITAAEEIAKNQALPTTVATIGKISCMPNASNIIPDEVSFTLDIRDVKQEGIDMVVKEISKVIQKTAEDHGLQWSFDHIAQSNCVELAREIVDIIEANAKEQKASYKLMNSGAVHDAVMMTGLTKVGMIFVPSVNGRSHVPEELTSYEDIQAGCDLLLNTVIDLATN